MKTKTIGEIFSKDPKIICRNVDVFYGEKQAIKDVSIDIMETIYKNVKKIKNK